jgi:hypothetical protein
LCLSQLNLLGKAHARDFSAFTKHCTSFKENDFAADESYDFWNAGREWTDNDVGLIALDRERPQLSNHPTLLSKQPDVEYDPIGSLSAVFFEF